MLELPLPDAVVPFYVKEAHAATRFPAHNARQSNGRQRGRRRARGQPMRPHSRHFHRSPTGKAETPRIRRWRKESWRKSDYGLDVGFSSAATEERYRVKGVKYATEAEGGTQKSRGNDDDIQRKTSANDGVPLFSSVYVSSHVKPPFIAVWRLNRKHRMNKAEAAGTRDIAALRKSQTQLSHTWRPTFSASKSRLDQVRRVPADPLSDNSYDKSVWRLLFSDWREEGKKSPTARTAESGVEMSPAWRPAFTARRPAAFSAKSHHDAPPPDRPRDPARSRGLGDVIASSDDVTTRVADDRATVRPHGESVPRFIAVQHLKPPRVPRRHHHIRRIRKLFGRWPKHRRLDESKAQTPLVRFVVDLL